MSYSHARDIDDMDFLRAVQAVEAARGWVSRWDVGDALPGETPEKVVLAKARRLINRGLMTGCACGCRGDFELTPAGAVRVSGEETR